jgi:hypothetical protein
MRRLLCFLGFHNWRNIQNEKPDAIDGEKIHYTNLHICKECGKYSERYVGYVTK